MMKRFRRLRIKRGLTQLDVATLIGVHPSIISAWETGRYEPSIAYVEKLCYYFRIQPTVVYDEPDGAMPNERHEGYAYLRLIGGGA